MTEQQFAYWLQGFAELNPNAPTQEQWQSIRDHLALVFDKRTPPLAVPPVDLSKNSEVGQMLKEASERFFRNPLPQPTWVNSPSKPGEIIC